MSQGTSARPHRDLDLSDVSLSGSALPLGFLQNNLTGELARHGVRLRATGWDAMRRKLRALGASGGPVRVCNHVMVPLAGPLGYAPPVRQDPVITREGEEDGGWLLATPDGASLRAWAVGRDTDLDAPHRRGQAYRFSPTRSAQRVLLASGELAGLLSDGDSLRLLICDPARGDSHLTIPLSGGAGWRDQVAPPDSYRVLLALAGAAGLRALPAILDAARLAQTQVTRALREQARAAVEQFLQAVLDQPANAGLRRSAAAAPLWREGLVLIYRLLFILKLEASTDPARGFSFAATSLWRGALSPNQALGPLVRRHLDQGHATSRMLEDGLRALFRVFRDGLRCSEVSIAPLGGALFGGEAMPLLDGVVWGERAVALLLDRLLWTDPPGAPRERIHYGALDVEELGRVYEALLELEPGIAEAPMLRLRRAKLEAVVPQAVAQAGEGPGIASSARAAADASANQTSLQAQDTSESHCCIRGTTSHAVVAGGGPPSATFSGPAQQVVDPGMRRDDRYVPVPRNRQFDDSPKYSKRVRGRVAAEATVSLADPPTVALADGKVTEMAPIAAGSFFLRAGIGRKASGSYYTPHEFVRFLVRETLGPLIAARSPPDDPDPEAILCLKIVDPAVGSGHFLVEACRFVGDALYAACRLCDEQAARADPARAAVLHARLAALPDPSLVSYLPSRVAEGGGVAEMRAQAICRRLVAVHCLYGVDRNHLAIELAKLSLWLESYAEGMPLTFLDHRLVQGDSLAAPFFAQLATLPVGGGRLDPLLARGVAERLAAARDAALAEVGRLQASVGRDIGDVVAKAAAKQRLDRALLPLRQLARAWAGAVALQGRASDDEFLALAHRVADTGAWPARLTPHQAALLAAGQDALPWDLTFPEAFVGGGFDAVLGNPPWDMVQYQTREFVAGVALEVLDAPTKQERAVIEARVLADPVLRGAFEAYRDGFTRMKRLADRLYHFQRNGEASRFTSGNLDLFRLFAERNLALAGPAGSIGMLMPASFHAMEGSAAIRRCYLAQTRLETCLSFENRRRLFDVHGRLRFDVLVARRPGPTAALRCAFYQDGFDALHAPERLLTVDADFLARAGGRHMTFPELRTQADLAACRMLFGGGETLGTWCRRHGISFGRELHMTDDAPSFVRLTQRRPPDGHCLLYEGKTFYQYTDQWDTPPRYAVPLAALAGKPAVAASRLHYRLVFRDIASAGDEHTMIAAIAPAGVVCGHTATIERTPAARASADALTLCGVLNSAPFEWLARLKAVTHLSLYLVEDLPLPPLSAAAATFLAHAALLLSCNHDGYAALWREQTGRRWRAAPLPDWEARWQLRAAVDAVVAHAYGLTRALYEHVLGGFPHKAFTAMPLLCLEAFDTLGVQGEATFCQRHDRLADLPLPRCLPRPVRLSGDAAAGLESRPALFSVEAGRAHRNPVASGQGRSRPARAGGAV